MQREFFPRPLDLRAFAQAGASLSGETPLADLPRLVEDAALAMAAEAARRPARWTAHGESREQQGGSAQVWLHLEANATIPLTCQRCMQPVEEPLDAKRSFRFVVDEQTAEAEDDEAEEDVLVLERDFDLLALVEDELLMAMPLVPRHDVCPVQVKLVVADAEFAGNPEKPVNPFAVLGRLRDNKPS